jgi:hypothetical protein
MAVEDPETVELLVFEIECAWACHAAGEGETAMFRT